jgi:hypothetical protein
MKLAGQRMCPPHHICDIDFSGANEKKGKKK